jgi:amidase
MTPTAAADLLYRPVTEQADLVRKGEVTSRELVEASLDRIEALNPTLNAFVALDGDRALAAADAIGPGDERPFAGVPIGIKDLTPVEGLPLTFGSDLFGDFRPSNDSYVVRRFKDAGFVIVGITNMPEMGIVPTTEPRRYGAARNPWDTGRTTGGSSGGSGAAVASGMVPIAHATDGGGSTRIPAACCGLVGLNPARGRISLGPDVGEHLTTVAGVLSRTVPETAAVLDVLAGYELGDATWAPPPAEPFARTMQREPGRLRIGFTLKPPIEAPVDAMQATAVRDAADLLVELGHEVEEIDPPWDQPQLLQLFNVAFGTFIALVVGFGATIAGREPTPEDVEPLSLTMFRRATEDSALALHASITQLEAFSRTLIGYLAPYDAVLTPALAERPLELGEIDTTEGDGMAAWARGGQFTPFTAMANVTGAPAISLPLYHGDDGLPLCVQLIGQPAAEGSLLGLANQLEVARPWADRRPALDF